VLKEKELSQSDAVVSLREGRRWFRYGARFGYAARGLVYLTIGGLALLAALGKRAQTADAQGAIDRLANAPGGWMLVAFVALGLLTHSGWRFCQAILDADLRGRDPHALLVRAALLCSGIVHLGLAVLAGKRAIGWAASGELSSKSLVERLMSQPFGHWLVGALGLVLIGIGIAQLMKGHRETFEARFNWKYEERRKLILFCKFGLYARGVIFAISGCLTVYAAWTTDTSEAGGLRDALDWLRRQSFGPALLAVAGIGLMCFGIYSFVAAAYRQVRSPV
jgi:hypothetical protein